MNNDELVNGISNIDVDIIESVATLRKNRSKKPIIFKFSAMAAAFCIILSIALFAPHKSNDTSFSGITTLAIEAEYPETPKFPDEKLAETDWETYYKQSQEWLEYNREVCGYPTKKQLHGVDEFLKNTAAEFLKNSDGENILYSPINVYFAVSMLAEVTAGESRTQILELLGYDSIEELRQAVNVLWKANYRDDGTITALFANSFWLSDKENYNRETLNLLKNNYYASSYSGVMGSPEYTAALKEWLNEQTGGLLEDSVENLEGFSKDTILALVSTLYFKASWQQKFVGAYNTTETFYSPSGNNEREFMNENQVSTYYYSENYSAISKSLLNYGNMYFILPDEGVSPEELISSGDALDFIIDKSVATAVNGVSINFKVPKFDITANLDLIDGFKNLGVTDIFDEKSDMSSVVDTFAYVSKIDHSARVKIDEDGCEAAAYTVVYTDNGAVMPKDEVDFFLNRPFIFVVTSPVNTPLFIGVINNP